jgi:hypothetical protein
LIRTDQHSQAVFELLDLGRGIRSGLVNQLERKLGEVIDRRDDVLVEGARGRLWQEWNQAR